MRQPRRLAVALAGLALVATSCAFDAGSTGEQVVGAWDLEGLAVDGLAVPMASDLSTTTIRFLDDGRFEGRGPCNDFAGLWSYKDGLGVSGLTQNAAACEDPGGGSRIMDAERALMGALFDAGRFEIRRVGDVLQISSNGYVLTWRLALP